MSSPILRIVGNWSVQGFTCPLKRFDNWFGDLELFFGDIIVELHRHAPAPRWIIGMTSTGAIAWFEVESTVLEPIDDEHVVRVFLPEMDRCS